MVYTSSDLVLVGYLKGMLEDQGYSCLIRNEYLYGAAGELPPTAVWPELWITDDAWCDRARGLVESALKASAPTADTWRCGRCREEIEGQFTQCWSCGTSRPV